MKDEQIQLKTKSGKIVIRNSEVLKTRNEIKTYLFTRWIFISYLPFSKRQNSISFRFKLGGVLFTERLRSTGLLPGLILKTFSNFQKDSAEIQLSLKVFPS